MTKVKVTWFHNLKRFGEGICDDGRKVFLSLSALKRNGEILSLYSGEVVGCRLRKSGTSYIATLIDRDAFKTKDKKSSKERSLTLVPRPLEPSV